jgi:hypothetical protein
MKTVARLTGALVAGFAGGLLADYVRARERPREETHEASLLLADAAPEAAQHALTSLQERPGFAMDEQQRPYAMAFDIDDVRTGRVGGKPALLEEAQPDRSD